MLILTLPQDTSICSMAPFWEPSPTRLHSDLEPSSLCISTSLVPHWHLHISTKRAAIVLCWLDPKCSQAPRTLAYAVSYYTLGNVWCTRKAAPRTMGAKDFGLQSLRVTCLGPMLLTATPPPPSSRATVHFSETSVGLANSPTGYYLGAWG